MLLLQTFSIMSVLYMNAAENEPRYEKTGFFAYAITKTQISFAVTAKLISTFVFAIRIVQSLYYLNPKIQASSHLLWLFSPVCVGPGRKPRRPFFSQRGSNKDNQHQFAMTKHYDNAPMQYTSTMIIFR